MPFSNPSILAMKRSLPALLLLMSLVGVHAQSTFVLDSTTLTSIVVQDSLDIPWEIIWGPDDFIWSTERFGRVSRINPETGRQKVLLDLSSEVYVRSEAGMLGMVLHPDFENNPHVFIAYTYVEGSQIRERLVRFNYDGTKLVAADTLIENILGNNTHVGCRLLILPDNTLLMSTGDAQDRSLPLDKTSVVGKILRLNLDGTIPNDNPDPSSYVWSYGHRNAQGLWQAPNGKIYSSEHGPTTDDELNIITPDGNFGWPTVAGFCDSPPEDAYCAENNVTEPLAAWTPTIAPSDIIWYDHPAIPEFKDKLLMTVLKDKSLIAFGFNEAGDQVLSQEKYFKDELSRLRDICVAPNGKIYLATSGDSWANSNPFTHTIVELSNEDYTTGVLQHKDAVSVSIGPNPLALGQPLYVNVPAGHNGQFTLLDMYGRPLVIRELQGHEAIDIAVQAGVYLWKVQLENGSLSEGKLVIR